MELRLAGLASNFDWESLVTQLTDLERAPQRRLRTEQDRLEEQNNVYGSIVTQLNLLKSRADALKETSLYASRSVRVGDATVASATADTDAALGSYTFAFQQLATAALQRGTTDVGKALSTSSDVSGVVLSSAPLTTAVTTGTFTVNGAQVTVGATDTLQDVFTKISTATSGSVTASYSSATDKITLTGTGTITLGTAADTSNFLQAFRLYNNGTTTVASSAALGAIKPAAALSAANFGTAINDASGTGKFSVNGVEIGFTSADTVNDVLRRINDSAAGVTASYDTINDRFTLTNDTTGDLGVALRDVSGNFLAASGLLGGTLERGKNLLYTINGGGQLTSSSNVVTEASSGLAGISVTALKEGGSTTVAVDRDTEKVKSALNGFIAAYNEAQAFLDTATASSTDAKGAVTTSVLSGDSLAYEITSKLRSSVNAYFSGLSGSLKNLDALGIKSNGTDDKLALSDSAKLDDYLATNLEDVADFFTNETHGLATKLSTYLDETVGLDGSLGVRQDSLGRQIRGIDTQVSDLERQVLANREQLVKSFVAMEEAQSRINSQLQYLQRTFSA
jgi:flagellar hook-associated protein 2